VKLHRKTSSLRRMAANLRKRCPALAPVRVRRKRLKDALGECVARWDAEGVRVVRFDIYIDPRLSWDATWQTLIHEWAHAVAWHQIEGEDDHDDPWGVAYARCYRNAD
jgi:hypothetical protein